MQPRMQTGGTRLSWAATVIIALLLALPAGAADVRSGTFAATPAAIGSSAKSGISPTSSTLSTTTTTTMPPAAAIDPCKLSAREQIAQGVTCNSPSTTSSTTSAPIAPGSLARQTQTNLSSTTTATTSTTSAPIPPGALARQIQTKLTSTTTATTSTTSQANRAPATAATDPCKLSAREQAALGVTCKTQATPVNRPAPPVVRVATPAAAPPGAPATPPGTPFVAPSTPVVAPNTPVITPNAAVIPSVTPSIQPAAPVTRQAAPINSPGTAAATPPAGGSKPADAVLNSAVPASQRNNADTFTMSSAGAPGALPPTLPSARRANKMPDEQHEPGQLIILWDEAAEAREGLAVLAREYSARPISRVDLEHLGGTLATFQLADNKTARSLLTTLRRKYPTWHVDLHARYFPLDGPRIYLPSRVDAPQNPFVSPKLRIGMLDGPVAPIRALRNTQLTQHSFLASSDLPASAEHGTTIAALIAGREPENGFQGFAAGAQLFAGTIMRHQGEGEGSTNAAMLLRGMDWLIGEKVRIINLSLGGPSNDPMAAAFAKLQKWGLIVVAAAGNGGSGAPPSYPGAYRDVIAVTAVDALDRPYGEANRGSYIMLAAPGVDLWTPDTASGHYVTGTSFSAAVVSSAVALMLSYRADLSLAQVRAHLCRNARGQRVAGQDPVYGCGMLQIGRTLAGLREASMSLSKNR